MTLITVAALLFIASGLLQSGVGSSSFEFRVGYLFDWLPVKARVKVISMNADKI